LAQEKDKRIYISDLDGTLLRDDATLSEYARKELTRLLDEGVNFTIASARSIKSLRPVLGDIPFRLPIIEINGSFITDYHTGKHLVINRIETDTVRGIIERVRRLGMEPFVSTYNGREDCLYYEKILNGGMQWYHDDRKANGDSRLRRTDDIGCVFDEEVISLNVMGGRDEVKPVADCLEADFGGGLENFFFENSYSPGWWWLTIHDKRACKSIAIRELLEIAGFDLENLTVFGDNLNDRKMFQMAAECVAVANATDEIKQYATKVIGSNESDAVVKYIAAVSSRRGA